MIKTYQKFDWPLMRPSVFNGFHHCLPALTETGNNLIVDHIIENKKWLSHLVMLLAPFDVFFVGIYCSLNELERRERERGNRRMGEARADHQTVHSFSDYDLEIDSTHPNQNNVETVINTWKSRKHSSVFERLAACS